MNVEDDGKRDERRQQKKVWLRTKIRGRQKARGKLDKRSRNQCLTN